MSYVEPTQQQKELIAKVKKTEQEMLGHLEEIMAIERASKGTHNPHWASIAKTHTQEGRMAAVRSIFNEE